MYAKVCLRDQYGIEHVLAITRARSAIIVALLSAERDLRALLSREHNPLLQREYQRMLMQIQTALAGEEASDVSMN